MTTTQQKTNETTRSDASTATQRKHRRGLAAAGAIVIVGFGAGLTALIIGVTEDADTQAPSPNVPPSVEVPFDTSDPNALTGIDRRLYELAEQHRIEVPFDASDPKDIEGIDRRLYELAEQHRKAER